MQGIHLTELFVEPRASSVTGELDSTRWLSSLLTRVGQTSPRDTQALSAQGFGEAQGLSENTEHLGSGNGIKTGCPSKPHFFP